MSKRLVAITALVLLAAGGLAVTSPAGGASESWTPIGFVIPAGQCSQIPPTLVVTGTGTMKVTVDGRGTFHTVATGTATDNNEGSYRFNYTNANDALFNPAYTGPYPVDITMTDHFNLVGNGGVNTIHARFTWKIRVNGPNFDITEVFFKGRGGSFEGCDPI